MDAWVQALADQAAAAPPLVMLLLVLFGGLVSSASPCVLAAVPLVVTAIGGQARTRWDSIKLSLAFVLGMALCFTALGAVAALTSSLIGDIGWGWKVLLGLILLVMGAQMAGFIHLRLPQMDGTRFRNAGVFGAFALGALTGTLSAPCATPMLVVVLSLVAFQKKVVFGILLLLAYSLGHVLLLFLAGAFSGFASAYLKGRGAKVGHWLHRAFGTAMVLLGLWVLWTQVQSFFPRSESMTYRGEVAEPHRT
jgi:cytochrome c biogenesis protein CcdA